jgi:Cu2+-exporting ATPase
VTGESTPVAKRPGDRVIAGALNRSGSMRFRATRVGADTTVAQIAALVEQAQRSKAPGQRVADRAAHYLVLLAVGAGAATFAAWLLAGASLEQALSFAIAAVVIACPDALGVATPTAVAVGTGVGARHNILFKDAAALETLARITTVVLDKTGTLTEGKPTLTDIVVSSALNAQRAALEPQGAHASAADKHPHDSALSARHAELLWLVASAEQASEHPLAAAIVQEARARGIALAEAAPFEARAGRGIRAVVDGRTVLVGNAQLMAEAGIDPGPLAARAATLAGEGKTPVFVAVDGQAAGLLAVADAVKPTAAETVRRLKELAIKPVMITGDTERMAAAVARQLGIERFFAEVLPADKAAHVRALQADGQRVAMVGDGVNDAPALAQADIGIAIGAGADVAIETADVVLMKSDPLDIVRAFTISRATVRKMRQNLFWAAIYNLLAIPVAAGLLYPVYGIALRPEWAALLMSLSSIIVAVNAVLLRRVERQLDAPVAAAPLAPARTG